VVLVPESFSWTDAAALPVGLTTEHDALVTQGGFTSGQSVLITGATSGVGMIGIQMARALGASMVIATTTSGAKVNALRAVGADLVINTSIQSTVNVVDTATGGDGVSIVLDHVGGALFSDLFMATSVKGTIVNIGRLSGAKTTIDLDQLSFRRLQVLGTTFSIRTAEERGDVAAAIMLDVVPAVADGRIRPTVDRVVPFEQAQRAADSMRAGDSVGKVVIDISAGEV
jgi:NADPH2:quinone reductase